jgi:hypothetical protein
MRDEFIEEMMNASHQRLFSDNFNVVASGYHVLESLGLRITSEEHSKKFQDEVDAMSRDYRVRLKEISELHNHLRQNDERLWLERKRLELMLKFCEKFFNKHKGTV